MNEEFEDGYAELCPNGDKKEFVASTLRLIEVLNFGDKLRTLQPPRPEPNQIEKEFGRVRKALASLSRCARVELLSRECEIYGPDFVHLNFNRSESALFKLENTIQEKYKRPLRLAAQVRMNVVIFAAEIFSSHGGIPGPLKEDSFVPYIERLIEDCGMGDIDAERLIRDYNKYKYKYI